MSAELGFLLPGSPLSGTPGYAEEFQENPESAPKRQQLTTNDEDSVGVEEYAEYPSAHWMVQLSG